jgi:hypothetical protein
VQAIENWHDSGVEPESSRGSGRIPWRRLLPCVPPRQTVNGRFAARRDVCVWRSIDHRLVMFDRERVGREASPCAAGIDSQSVRTSEAGGPYGYDSGKKIKGHIAPPLSLRRARLRRQRLRRHPGMERDLHRHRDRSQDTGPGRVRGASARVGRRVVLRMAGRKPSCGKGLRGNRRVCDCLPLHRFSHAVDQAPGSFHTSSASDAYHVKSRSGANVSPKKSGAGS